jgi:hypothetical protein
MVNLFENLEDGWTQFLPDFDYIYNNLGDIPDAKVERLNNKFLAASLLALKHSFEKEWLENNALKMLILAESAPIGLQKSLIVYLFGRGQFQQGTISKILESLSLQLKDTVMNTLDIFIEKGRKEGEEKKSYEFVKKLLLADRFTVAEIANFASVTEDYVQKVKEALH